MPNEGNLARRAAELAERASAAHPTSWRPNDPAKGHPQLLVGELVRVDEGHTSYGPKKIAVLRTVDGELFGVWLLHAVLQQEFARQRPRIGELIAVRYVGHVPGRDGQPGYEKFRLVVDRQDAGADWSALTTDAGVSPEASPEPRPFAGVEPSEASPPPDEPECELCGYREPEHAAGCPNDDLPPF